MSPLSLRISRHSMHYCMLMSLSCVINIFSCIANISSTSHSLSDQVLSQGLDDLGTTRGECLGRTWWSSSLDWTTYLYYFYKWLYTTSPWSHVLLECSTITWPCHMIWLLKFPCYLYLVFIIWLDICDQVFECMGNFFLLRALITPRLIITVVPLDVHNMLL